MTLINWIDHQAPADGPPPRSLVPFVIWAFRGSWKPQIVAGFFAIAAGALEVLSALVLGRVVDVAVNTQPGQLFNGNLGVLLAALGFFVVLRPLVFGSTSYLQSLVVTPNLFNLILSRLHRWTLGQTIGFFDNDFAGRIAQKEIQTASALSQVAVEVNQTVLFALASVLGAALMLLSLDGWVALILVGWITLVGLLLRYFIPRVRKASQARAGARALVSGKIVDTVTNIKTVKLFAHADHEDREALDAMEQFRDRAIDFGRLSVSFRFVQVLMSGILPVILVGGALLKWNSGVLSAGDITATGVVAIRLSQMTGWVSFSVMALYANLGEVEDGIRTLTPPPDLTDADAANELSITQAEIRYDAVGFAYGRDVGGVTDVNLTIAPGEKVGIVGASGAGKSTLVALLLRLYDTERGQVLIDGQSVADVTQDSLRRQIGMVTQETEMFNRSARDNILYGRPNASEEDMIAAAKRAEAHDFILDLQDHKGRTGYDAHLGERGVKLSGGQRQRIALTRAILKDAPILVLDEATSALDSEVEAAIQSALHRVMEGKTVLAIAHRLSTLSEMDRIIVMDQGQIVESGSHDNLLTQNGLYAQFWARQSGGFIRTEAAQ